MGLFMGNLKHKCLRGPKKWKLTCWIIELETHIIFEVRILAIYIKKHSSQKCCTFNFKNKFNFRTIFMYILNYAQVLIWISFLYQDDKVPRLQTIMSGNLSLELLKRTNFIVSKINKYDQSFIDWEKMVGYKLLPSYCRRMCLNRCNWVLDMLFTQN